MTERADFFKTEAGRTPHEPDAENLIDDIDHVLGRSWFFDPQTIKVMVEDGNVRLIGTVRSERERRMAASAAWAHEGVTDVDNRLVVDEAAPV